MHWSWPYKLILKNHFQKFEINLIFLLIQINLIFLLIQINFLKIEIELQMECSRQEIVALQEEAYPIAVDL